MAMSTITTKVTAKQIIAAIDATGATVPKAVAETYQQTLQLSQATGNLAPHPDALAAAVTTALDHGHDPAADPEVQRVLAATQIANQGLTNEVEAIAYHRFRDVCKHHTTTIIDGWSAPFDEAATILATAHQRIGSVPLEDTATILQRGEDIADVWAEAQNAVATVNSVTAGWAALAEFTHQAANNPRYHLLRIAEVSPATWTQHQLGQRRLTVWEAVILGLELTLPTMSEYRSRVAAIEGHEHEQSHQPVIDRTRSLIAGRPIHVTVG